MIIFFLFLFFSLMKSLIPVKPVERHLLGKILLLDIKKYILDHPKRKQKQRKILIPNNLLSKERKSWNSMNVTFVVPRLKLFNN